MSDEHSEYLCRNLLLAMTLIERAVEIIDMNAFDHTRQGYDGWRPRREAARRKAKSILALASSSAAREKAPEEIRNSALENPERMREMAQLARDGADFRGPELPKALEAGAAALADLASMRKVVEAARPVAVYRNARKDYQMDNGEAGVLIEWELLDCLHHALASLTPSQGQISKKWCLNMAAREAAAGDPETGAGAAAIDPDPDTSLTPSQAND